MDEYNNGHEADQKQLQSNKDTVPPCVVDPSQSFETQQSNPPTGVGDTESREFAREIFLSLMSYKDDYSVINGHHPDLVDLTKPNHKPFRWLSGDSLETCVILDESGKFGPYRFIELDVDPVDEDIFDFHIKRIYVFEVSEDGSRTISRQDGLPKVQTVRLYRGELFSNSQLDSMATAFDCHWSWEFTEQLSLFPLIQYWVFHHQEAVDQHQKEEMHDA